MDASAILQNVNAGGAWTMVLQQLLRLRETREEELRRRFFEAVGLEEEDEDVRLVVKLRDKPELLEVSLQCKYCDYEALLAVLLPEVPESWRETVVASAGSAVARFKAHPCKRLV
jgi:hypothetical protein